MKSLKTIAYCLALALCASNNVCGQAVLSSGAVYDNGTGYTGDIVSLGATGQFVVGDEIFLSNYGDVVGNPTPGAYNSVVNRARLLVATEGFSLSDSATITLSFSGPALDAADPLASSGFVSLGQAVGTVTLNNSGNPVGMSEVWFDLGNLVLPPRVLFEVEVSNLPPAAQVGLPSYGVPTVGDSYTDFSYNNTFRLLPNGPANFGLSLWTDDGIPPSFVTQPSSQTVGGGASLTLTASAAGNGVSYEWFKDGSRLLGLTAPSLLISDAADTDSGDYTITATDAGGTVTSSTATVVVDTVGNPPTITSPAGGSEIRNAIVGSDVTFTVVDTPAGNTYSWRRLQNGNPVGQELSTTGSLSLTDIQQNDAGSYQVVVSNTDGSQTATFTLNVFDGLEAVAVAPIITAHDEGDLIHIKIQITGFVEFSELNVDWNVEFNGIGGGFDPDVVTPVQLMRTVLNPAGPGLAFAELYIEEATISDNGIYSVTISDGLSVPVTVSRPITVTLDPIEFVEANSPGTVSLQYVGKNFASLRAQDGQISVGAVPAFPSLQWTVVSLENANLITVPALDEGSESENLSPTAAITAVDPNIAATATLRLQGIRRVIQFDPFIEIGSPFYDQTFTLTLGAQLAPPTVSLSSVTALEGDDVTLGTPRNDPSGTTYQWRKNGATLSGQTGPTLALANVGASDEASYTLVVTLNQDGQTASASATATLNVDFGIEIVQQPSSFFSGATQVIMDVNAGGQVVTPTQLQVGVTGRLTELKWTKNGIDLTNFFPAVSGAGLLPGQSAIEALDLSTVGTSPEVLAGVYTVILRNDLGQERVSEPIELVPAAAPPAVLSLTPATTTVDLNATPTRSIVYNATFEGDLPITADFKHISASGVETTLDTQTISSGSSWSYTLLVDALADEGTYVLVLSNTEASAQASATVDVQQAPVITQVPIFTEPLTSGAALVGSNISVTISNTTGARPITFELFNAVTGTLKDSVRLRNGSPNEVTLNLGGPDSIASFPYRVVATNADGTDSREFNIDWLETSDVFLRRLSPTATNPNRTRRVNPVALIGETTTFSARNNASGSFSYVWTLPDGTEVAGSDITIDPSVGGVTGTYSVVGSNALGGDTASFNLQTFTIVPVPSIVNQGDDVRFGIELSSPVDGVSFVWTKGGQPLSTTSGLISLNNADARFDNGVYNVTATRGGSEIANETFNLAIATTKLGLFTDPVIDPARQSFSDTATEGFVSNEGATVTSGEPGIGANNSIWATWVAPFNGELTVKYEQIAFLGLIDVFDSNLTNDSLNFTTTDAEEKTVTVAAGETYFIRIAGIDSNSGDGYFTLSFAQGGATIGQITASPSSISNTGISSLSLPITGGENVNVVWSDNGSRFVALSGESLDSTGAFVTVVAADPVTSASSATITATITETVNGQTLTSFRATSITRTPPVVVFRPTVRSFSFFDILRQFIRFFSGSSERSIVTLQDGSQQRLVESSFYFNNTGLGKAIGEPNHGGVVGGNSSWNTFTPEISGQATITTDGSEFDTILAVYRPTSSVFNFDTLEEVAFDDNSGLDGQDSSVTFPVVVGERYFVVVDGVAGAQGVAALNYTTRANLEVEILALTPTLLTPGSSLLLRSSVGAGEGVTFQWFRDDSRIVGATSDSYAVDAVGVAAAGSYTVRVTEFGVSAVSEPVNVTIVGPEIVDQPQDLDLLIGESGTLQALAASATPVSYQWFRNGVAIPGETGARLTVTTGGTYFVNASDASGTTTSATATVTFVTPPTFVQTPTAQLIENPGSSVFLSVQAEGDIAGYQWQFNGEPIPGATGPNYIIPSFTIAEQGLYSVVVFGVGDFQLESRRVPVVFADAPFITLQPSTQVADDGDFVLFRVAFESATPATVVWKRNGEIVSFGRFALIFGISQVGVADEGVYTAEITNARGTSVSRPAVLDVLAPPIIDSVPSSQTVIAGDNVVFSASVSGDGPITTQWLRNGIPLAGATGTTLSLSGVDAGDAGNYSLRATNDFGSVTTPTANLGVIGTLLFVTQPESRLVAEGSDVAFEASVIEVGTISYQWLFNGAPIAGEIGSTLTLASVAEGQSGLYSLVATNEAGSVTSEVAELTVGQTPLIVAGPLSVVEKAGADASFSVEATGFAPLSYQWFFNGSVIEGATLPTLTVTAIDEADAGLYSVRVTNPLGAVDSAEAELTVGSGVEIASITAIVNGEGQSEVTLTIIGLDGRSAFVQRSQNLVRWRNVGRLLDDSDGIFRETISARTEERYYRVILVD